MSRSCCDRYKGLIRADLLQHFAAEKLLELPQVPAVTRRNLDRFLARVPHHRTTLLAFSKTAGASIALRQAAQQTNLLLAAGRVQWQDEVRPSNGRDNSSCISVLSDASLPSGRLPSRLTCFWQLAECSGKTR